MIKRFLAVRIKQQEVIYQMGARHIEAELAEPPELQQACPYCNRMFTSSKANPMYCRRCHGRRCPAGPYVIGSVCPSCDRDIMFREIVLDHLMRGALACTLPWRLGQLEPFPPDLVLAADMDDRAQRKAARPSGSRPGVGIPVRQV